MRIYIIPLVLFLILSPLFAATQSLVMSEFPDTIGSCIDNAAIYARFKAMGSVKFIITGPDVWFVSGLATGEDVAQINPIVLANIGSGALDFAFQILDDDIFPVNPWVSQPTWTPTANPGEYTLGLIICDPDIPFSPPTTEWANNDILRLAMSRWYESTGTFKPATDGFEYEHEGLSSLSLWSGPPGENIVHLYYRVVMSLAGALDTGPHAAQLEIQARLTLG